MDNVTRNRLISISREKERLSGVIHELKLFQDAMEHSMDKLNNMDNTAIAEEIRPALRQARDIAQAIMEAECDDLDELNDRENDLYDSLK